MQQTLKTLKRSVVPKYLRTSELYLSFSDETGDEEISVPSDCIKADLTIYSLKDVEHLLRTMRFWILVSFPKELIHVLLSAQNRIYRSDPARVASILTDYELAFPGVGPLVTKLHPTKYKPGRDMVCEMAAKYGRVDFLAYCLRFKEAATVQTLNVAAAHGHLDCVKYIHNMMTTRSKSRNRASPLVNVDLQGVVRNGHVACLKFLVQHGAAINEETCLWAIQSQQLPSLNYLLDQISTWDEWLTLMAVKKGDVNALRCVVQHGGESVVGKRSLQAAVRAPCTDCLETILEVQPSVMHSAELSADFLKLVARASLPVLHVLLQRGYPFSPSLIADAASSDNLQCMQFLHQYCGFDCFVPSTMAAAAGAGRLHLIHQLHEQGCEWDETAPTAALQSDQWRCLRFFLTQRGIPQTPAFKALTPSVMCAFTLAEYATCMELRQLNARIEAVEARHTEMEKRLEKVASSIDNIASRLHEVNHGRAALIH